MFGQTVAFPDTMMNRLRIGIDSLDSNGNPWEHGITFRTYGLKSSFSFPAVYGRDTWVPVPQSLWSNPSDITATAVDTAGNESPQSPATHVSFYAVDEEPPVLTSGFPWRPTTAERLSGEVVSGLVIVGTQSSVYHYYHDQPSCYRLTRQSNKAEVVHVRIRARLLAFDNVPHRLHVGVNASEKIVDVSGGSAWNVSTWYDVGDFAVQAGENVVLLTTYQQDAAWDDIEFTVVGADVMPPASPMPVMIKL